MRIILLLDQGVSYREIEEQLGAFPSTISPWKQRFEKDSLLGLATIHPGQPPQKLTPQLRAKVLEKMRQGAPGRIYALVATQDGGSHEGQQEPDRARLEGSGSDAHRLARYMASNDPQFEEKAAEIIGLYFEPPAKRCYFLCG